MDELRPDVSADDVASPGRRDLLRRGATVGAAMAFTTPVVQQLGRVPAFAQSSPAPPPPPPPGVAGLTAVGLVFVCNGVPYRALWRVDGGWNAIGANPAHCAAPTGWSTATVYPNPAAIGVSTVFIGGELYQVTFTLPATCTASTGSGVAEGGQPPHEYCTAGVVGADPRIITFTANVN